MLIFDKFHQIQMENDNYLNYSPFSFVGKIHLANAIGIEAVK